MKKSSISFILVSLFLFFGWNSDPAVNTPICTYSGAQALPQITPDGSNGAIITWHDSRNGNFDIYAQRVDSGGTTLWTADGVAISTASGGQFNPMITPDGSGGAIITWFDSLYDIYAQRVDSGGNTLWTADGVAISTVSGNQYFPMIIPDGSNGAIITWNDSRNGNYDIYAQRVDSGGNTLWTADGVAICTDSGNEFNPMLTLDGSGGAIITWHDYRSGSSDIYAQRVDSGGNTLWTADGVAICTASVDQLYPVITPDGSNGAIITWHDFRSGNYDIYAQRVDSGGTTLWTADGVAISTASVDQFYPVITLDGSSGAIITWSDLRSGSSDIYAQRVDSGGTTLWTADGVAISTASGNQNIPTIIPDGSNGAIITWYDYRSGNWDIYAQRVDSGGTTLWTADGVAISTASGNQHIPMIIPDGSKGAIITWIDYRNGNADIYAQNVCPDGSLGACMYFIHAAVSGGHGTVSPLNQSVPVGEDAFIIITPDPGYRINTIMDNGDSMPIANPYIIYDVDRSHDVVVTFTLDVFPPAINLTAVRRTEHAWIIQKDYGEITIDIIEHATNPMEVARYILYRIENGSMTQISEYTEAGNYTYIDKFLESDRSYGYQVVAVDAAGTIVAESEIGTI